MITIYPSATGEWRADYGDRQHRVRDGDLLSVGGDCYRIHLPDDATTTQIQLEEPSEVAPVWRFEVSRDEEHVALTLVGRTQTWRIGPRAFLYVLLTLARAKLRDQRDRVLPASSCGWVDQSELLDMLDYTTTRLHTDIYRARRYLGPYVDVGRLIERRPRAQQLRFGYGEIEIDIV